MSCKKKECGACERIIVGGRFNGFPVNLPVTNLSLSLGPRCSVRETNRSQCRRVKTLRITPPPGRALCYISCPRAGCSAVRALCRDRRVFVISARNRFSAAFRFSGSFPDRRRSERQSPVPKTRSPRPRGPRRIPAKRGTNARRTRRFGPTFGRHYRVNSSTGPTRLA